MDNPWDDVVPGCGRATSDATRNPLPARLPSRHVAGGAVCTLRGVIERASLCSNLSAPDDEVWCALFTMWSSETVPEPIFGASRETVKGQKMGIN